MATLMARTTWSLMPHRPRSRPSRDKPRGGSFVLKKKKKPKADYSVKTAKAETEGRKEDPKAGISSALALRPAQQAVSKAGMRVPATGQPLARR